MMRACVLLAAMAAAMAPGTRGNVEASAQEIEALWHRLPRPRLAVARTDRPPDIDGKIRDEEWQTASKATGFVGTDSPRWKGAAGFDFVGAQTVVQVTYDGTCLYVAFRCEEPEIETLKVHGRPGRDGSLWNDDCIELFLAPPKAGFRYHFIINSKGWIYDSRMTPSETRGKGWNMEGLRVAADVSPPGAGSHWSVEMAIPFAGLGVGSPKQGEVWGVNFCRERWAAMYRNLAELSTWSGLVGKFDQPRMYGELCFCDVQQDIRVQRPRLGLNEVGAGLTLRSLKARALKLAAMTASAADERTVGSGEVVLSPARPATAKVMARVKSEGLQYLALLVSDAKTGQSVSCTRAVFRVPEVLGPAQRVRARLTALRSKSGGEAEATEFAASIERQMTEVEAIATEAKALLARLDRVDAAPLDSWRSLAGRVGKLEAATTFVVWTNSPYVATGPSSMPPALGDPPTLVIEAAQNEVEHVTLNVTNLTETAMELQLGGQLPGQVGRARSCLNTTVQKAAQFCPRLLGKKPKDLPEKEDGLAMPLVEVNGLCTFFVRPFSTRQLWITVHTRGLKPGKRRRWLRLTTLDRPLPSITVPVDVTVWGLRIDDEAPIGVFCFDYAGDYEWMRSYKINLWFRGCFPHKLALDGEGNLKPYKTDIDRVKKRMAEGARRFLLSYGYAGSFIQWAEKNKIEYMSDRWRQLFKQILSRLVKEWLDAGLRYGDFALQTIDEAHGRQVQQVVDTTPLIREVAPKMRLAMTIMTGLDDLKRMAPHVDVWINRNGAMWGREQWDFFHSEQAKGKPIWSWNMPCTPKSQPLTQFRTYGWRAMKFDFDAVGFFNYFGMVYLPQRKGGGIATRHWEAWRDGVEDYQLLWTLREEIGKARGRGVAAETVRAAETWLAQLVDETITEKFFPANTQETHDRIQQARAKAAAEILRIRGLK